MAAPEIADLDPDERDIVAVVHDWVQDSVRPVARDLEHANTYPAELIETMKFRLVQSVLVRPDEALPFGSAPNALSPSPDNKTLAVACGGNNAVALIDLTGQRPGRISA